MMRSGLKSVSSPSGRTRMPPRGVRSEAPVPSPASTGSRKEPGLTSAAGPVTTGSVDRDQHPFQALPEIERIGVWVEGALVSTSPVTSSSMISVGSTRPPGPMSGGGDEAQVIGSHDLDHRLDDLGGGEIVRIPTGAELLDGSLHQHRVARSHLGTAAGEDEDALRGGRIVIRHGVLHPEAVAAHGGDDARDVDDQLPAQRRDMTPPLDVADAGRPDGRHPAQGQTGQRVTRLQRAGRVAGSGRAEAKVGGVIGAVGAAGTACAAGPGPTPGERAAALPCQLTALVP